MAMRTGMLDAPLLQLSTHGDFWDCRSAFMHQLVLGTTGSGKSSSTMKYTIKAMLQAGFGILFCVAKQEDAEAIKQYCLQTSRAGSLIDWIPGSGGFNFIAWELARGGNINNVVDLIVNAIEMIRNSGPSPGRVGDDFWGAITQLNLRHSVPIVFAATGSVRIEDLLAFIRTAPTTPEQMKDPDWQRESTFFRFFQMAAARLQRKTIPGFDDAAAERAINYWKLDYARLDPKTMGNIRITLTTALSRFEQGLLKDLFGGDTTIVPELLFHGAILLMNFPVQSYGEDAAIAQKLIKYMVQRACLARNGMEKSQHHHPVAIIADECQNFLHNDAEFLAQCRSSRTAVVFATQSIPTLNAKIGGEQPHDRTQHLISNFNTVVLHSSACPETNDWFARKIGRTLHQRSGYSRNQNATSGYGSNLGFGENWGVNSNSGGSSNYSSSDTGSSGGGGYS